MNGSLRKSAESAFANSTQQLNALKYFLRKVTASKRKNTKTKDHRCHQL
jgi:hypothetical protein